MRDEPRCADTDALAPEVVRAPGSETAQRLEAHARGCEPCARVLAGARVLGSTLAALEAPEPSTGLAERTLARIRLQAAFEGKAESGRLPAATPIPPAVPVPHPRQAPRRRTSVEILALFQELNRKEGLTVVLVTHEPDIAAYAGRTIELRDGVIKRDVRTEPRDSS